MIKDILKTNRDTLSAILLFIDLDLFPANHFQQLYDVKKALEDWKLSLEEKIQHLEQIESQVDGELP